MYNEEIDDYYGKFIDFVQIHLHKKYDLRTLRKRSRGQDQGEDLSISNPSKLLEK